MAPNLAVFAVDAILCDSAAVADGKLYLQGAGWNMLGTGSFPFQQPRIGLAVVIGVPYTGTNQNHTLSVNLEHEDGQPFRLGSLSEAEPQPDEPAPAGISAQFNVGRPSTIQPGDAQVLPFAINLDQLRFDAPGAYSFVIKIDGDEVKRLVFRVMSPVAMLRAG